MFLQFTSFSPNNKWVYHKIHVWVYFKFLIFQSELVCFLRNGTMWRQCHILLKLAFILHGTDAAVYT